MKRSYGETKHEASETYYGIRARWGQVQNLALESHGIAARVDHRSLAAQGIRDREPGLHQGPAVAGIESRGERSEVGQRQREQMAERQAVRDRSSGLERQLARQEGAAAKVASRALRELVPLAAKAPEADRAVFERQLEQDRQAQIGRVAAGAERRVERREQAREQARDRAAPEQLSLFTRLADQARALRERIIQTYAAVKTWVQQKMGWAATLERTASRPAVELSSVDRLFEVHAKEATGAQRSAGVSSATLEAGKTAARARHAQQKAERTALAQHKAEQERRAALELKVRQAREAEKAVLVDRLMTMAAGRAVQSYGWSDRGDHWEACSPFLKQMVDGLNRFEHAETRRAVIGLALDRPGMVERTQNELAQYRKNELALDRGMSR